MNIKPNNVLDIKKPTYSQMNQDTYLDENVFHGLRNGVYVDVGAHDGITYNNTLLFAKKYGWNGINIEPNNLVYDKLLANRPDDINIKCAVDIVDNDNVQFVANKGYTEMLSGLAKYYEKTHTARVNHENKKYGGAASITSVTTRRLDGILSEYGIQHIHLLSIDVEGA